MKQEICKMNKLQQYKQHKSFYKIIQHINYPSKAYTDRKIKTTAELNGVKMYVL